MAVRRRVLIHDVLVRALFIVAGVAMMFGAPTLTEWTDLLSRATLFLVNCRQLISSNGKLTMLIDVLGQHH